MLGCSLCQGAGFPDDLRCALHLSAWVHAGVSRHTCVQTDEEQSIESSPTPASPGCILAARTAHGFACCMGPSAAETARQAHGDFGMSEYNHGGSDVENSLIVRETALLAGRSRAALAREAGDLTCEQVRISTSCLQIELGAITLLMQISTIKGPCGHPGCSSLTQTAPKQGSVYAMRHAHIPLCSLDKHLISS